MRKSKKEWNLKRLIVCALRKIFFYSPLRRQCLQQAKMGDLYKCSVTKKKYPIDKVTVDHIDPVVDPKLGFVDWNTFIARLFCDVSNLQCISKVEHAKKTKEERQKRKSNVLVR